MAIYPVEGWRPPSRRCLLPGTPTPLPPGLMESWAWREFFASVFESKGLISKYSGIRTYGKIALPRSRFGNSGELSRAIRVLKERWQMAVVRHQGAASRSVSGDGQTSALANPIHSRAWRVGVSVLVITGWM